MNKVLSEICLGIGAGVIFLIIVWLIIVGIIILWVHFGKKIAPILNVIVKIIGFAFVAFLLGCAAYAIYTYI